MYRICISNQGLRIYAITGDRLSDQELILFGLKPERVTIMVKDIEGLTTDDRFAIADRIVMLRKESGYKSKEIAQQMDIGATTYSDIECANTKLSVDNLYKLCQVFDVSADYIIFGETEDSYLAEVRKIFRQRPGMAKRIVAGLKEMFG